VLKYQIGKGTGRVDSTFLSRRLMNLSLNSHFTCSNQWFDSIEVCKAPIGKLLKSEG